MNCTFDRGLLSLYADGALDHERVQEVAIHLSGCEECRRALEVVWGIGKALSTLPRERAPHGLIDRIVAKAEGTVRRTAWNSVSRSVGAVWTTAMNGFQIEDEKENVLQKELPGWVARWVLFV